MWHGLHFYKVNDNIQLMSGPFTEEQLVLIEIGNETASLLGHHHHHHHHGHGDGHHHNAHQQSQFKAPEKLNTSIGLYALKKLHAIDPKILKIRQARLLEPVTPGPITYFINGGFYLASGLYATYLWRTRGFRGFISLGVIPLLALGVAKAITNEGLNYMREGLYLSQRRQLVRDYSTKFGQQYLLKVLNPAFRI